VKWHSLQALGSLKAQLETARKLAAAEQARLHAAAQLALREQQLFSLSVGAVVSLPVAQRAELTLLQPAPHPAQRARDEQAALQESWSDGFDVTSLLDTDAALSYRSRDIGIDVVHKLRRGEWAIQAQLDLHGLRRDEARTQLGQFLRDVIGQGLRCIRIIHGKGHGSPGRQPVLKSKVHSWLVQKQEVLAFVQARPADGGNGALVVLLRPGP
jgi:DNA-nicking Smr family endonuclease